ncbi:AAA family ATPase [Conexibacter sp. W3-3-2]|uniref:ATP-binding protein n=1 Tax=Conexibacter sp. W3-3-2 TaxID=2675227 RepID=UPI0012B8867F|nr:LuxR family transcriptional regulator [Conexibacter sp. W3-3-2]MTD45825.1 AAA family ATPase [Conexibacter sp. W3-3-2]
MPTTLLGREGELDVLTGYLDELQAGRGSVLLVEGPAGIGKTALADAARRRLEGSEVLVLRARASELDREFAHGVVNQLLVPPLMAAGPDDRAQLLAGAAAGAAFLVAGATTAPVEPFAVLHGLHWLVLNLAVERPVLLVVDDLHWADRPSLRFLEHLGRRLEDTQVGILATMRRDEPGAVQALLDELAEGPVARTMRPAPLTDEQVGAVVARALGQDPDEAFVRTALEATGGNPLLTTVLAREAVADGLRGRADEAERLRASGARGVAPAVRRRLRTLGAPAERLARAAAVAGPRSTPTELAALAGLSSHDALQARAQLQRTEVLDAEDVFVHPLVRDAVIDECPADERARLHVEVARQLRERGALPQVIAVHRMAAPPAGDADAVRDLRAAADAAAAEGASEVAADLLARALVEPPPADARDDIALELAEAEVRAGQAAGPARLRALLADGLAGDRAARAHAALANHLVHLEPDAAVAELEAALADAQDPRLAHPLEAHLLEALLYTDAAMPAFAARMDAAAADPQASPAALAHLAVDRACRGATGPEIVELARRAEAGGRLTVEVGPASSTWNLLTHALRFAERAGEAQAVLVEGERLAQARGLRQATLFVEHAWGYWHRDFGSVATGAARAELGLQVIREMGLALTVPALAAILAEDLVHLDRLDEALTHIDVPLTEVEGTYVEPFALSSRALVRLVARRWDEAERDLRRLVDLADARGWRAPLAVRGRLRLTSLLAQSDRKDEALAVSDVDLAAADATGLAGARGSVLRVRAQALPADDGIEVLRQAVALLQTTEMRLELGWALHDLGARLRIRGDRRDAREPLRLAHELSRKTGSVRLARHVVAELESTGARPQREPVDGVDGLTPAERRVADLAAEGLTNREIAQTLWVSQKTVEMHLGRSFSKLGIRSRRALGEALGLADADA